MTRGSEEHDIQAQVLGRGRGMKGGGGGCMTDSLSLTDLPGSTCRRCSRLLACSLLWLLLVPLPADADVAVGEGSRVVACEGEGARGAASSGRKTREEGGMMPPTQQDHVGYESGESHSQGEREVLRWRLT